MTKTCKACGATKPIDAFPVSGRRGKMVYYSSLCRECFNEYQRNKYLERTRTKTCPHCNKTLPVSDFWRKPDSAKGEPRWDSWCKECKKSSRRNGKAQQRRAIKQRNQTSRPQDNHGNMACVSCAFFQVCKVQIWDAEFEPYCFPSSWRYELWVREYGKEIDSMPAKSHANEIILQE